MLRNPTWHALAATGAMAIALSAAQAQTFDVKQIEVEKGALEYGAENMFARGVPHELGSEINRWASEHSVAYGLTDWWKISAALKFEKPEELDARLAQAAIGNIFVLKGIDEKRAFDAGIGWFTEVSFSTHGDTTNTVVFGPIVTLKADKLSLTANPFFERTFGRNHEEGTAFVYGWQAKYEIREGFGLGVEGFGVIDNIGSPPPLREQEHRIGPVAYTEWELRKDYKVVMDVGVMFGLTEATPDAALKLNFGIPLHSGGNGNGKLR
jgi:hypothetical protein